MLAAFLSVLADLEWPAVVGVTALAWAIAAMVEWLAWQPGLAWPAVRRYPRSASMQPVRMPPVERRELEPVVYAEPPEEEPRPDPVYEPEPQLEEPVQEEPAVPAEPQPIPPAEPEPVTETKSVGAGLVPPADDPDPFADSPPTAPPADRPPRDRRLRIPQIRRRPSATEPAPPKEEPQPGVAEERPQPQLRALEPLLPAPEPVAPPPSAPPEPSVVRMSSRRAPEPQQWNLWDLESLARQEARFDPARRDEWSYLFVHLRQFADAEGTLPSEFDALIRESFGEMLEARNLV